MKTTARLNRLATRAAERASARSRPNLTRTRAAVETAFPAPDPTADARAWIDHEIRVRKVYDHRCIKHTVPPDYVFDVTLENEWCDSNEVVMRLLRLLSKTEQARRAPAGIDAMLAALRDD